MLFECFSKGQSVLPLPLQVHTLFVHAAPDEQTEENKTGIIFFVLISTTQEGNSNKTPKYASNLQNDDRGP